MRGLNENVSVPDIFCSGLGAVERLEGNCLRLYFYVSQAPEDGGAIRDKVVVARLIVPASAVPPALLKMVAATGEGAMQIVSLPPEMVH
jgi:hypothetical protein